MTARIARRIALVVILAAAVGIAGVLLLLSAMGALQ